MATMRHAGGVRRIYAAPVGTGSAVSNVANLTIPNDTHIIGVAWTARQTTFPLLLMAELSISSVQNIAVNDSFTTISSVFWEILQGTNVGAAGPLPPAYVPIPAFPIMAGQVLYLHALVTNAAQPSIACAIYLDSQTVMVPRGFSGR